MPFFNLGSVSFTNSRSTNRPDEFLNNSEYSSNIYKYPIDLGNTDKAHYVVFHINVQKSSKFPSSQVNGELPIVMQPPRIRGIGGQQFQPGASPTNLQTITNQQIRAQKRIKDTVAIYMPDTLFFNHTQSYSEPELREGALAGLAAAGVSITDSIKDFIKGDFQKGFSNLGQNFAAFAGTGLASYLQKKEIISESQKAIGLAAFNLAKNPMIELIYSAPRLRNFRFDFIFYPRNESEALDVQRIIEVFRFHQAPEFSTFGAGYFLTPPSEFDIQFYYNGVENVNIPFISTCVLESIDLDYAPNGFAAYEVQSQSYPSMGKTGMPVAIKMSLQFKETKILTKDDFNPQPF